jgi:predicted HicB family RNase H-like nuclease
MSDCIKDYGRTITGELLTDELIDKYVKEAEEGYDVDEMLKNRVDTPSTGDEPTSVRLEPELRDALANRAAKDRESTSAIIRRALRNYLEAG